MTLSTRKGRTGQKNTPEHNAKIAAAHRGRKLSPERIEQCRLASLGRKQTPQEIEARRLANTGKKRSPEFCERMRQLQANRTPEQKAAQAERTRQRNLNKTPEQKEKERLALVARNKARAGEKRQFPPVREAGSTDPVFYVYEHWRSDSGQPFYVGKGFKKRAYQMTRRNRHHLFVQDYLKRIGASIEVKIVAASLTERQAFDLEIELIEKWLTAGCKLVNITKGGDGPSGRKHTEEWKRANSERMKGRSWSDESRAKMSASMKGNKNGVGQTRTPEQISAFIERCSQKTPEQIAKMAATKKGKPLPWLNASEVRARAASTQRGRPKSASARFKMSLHKKTPEHRKKLQLFSNKQWANPTYRKKHKLAMKAWHEARAEKRKAAAKE